MTYLIYVIIGLLMGVFGGLLGVGGSVVMIPMLVIVFGENQHLYQASAMICNLFVGSVSSLVHRKTDTLMPKVLKWLIPSAAVGSVVGVAMSNASAFAGERSYLLARLFGVLLAYTAVYNIFRLRGSRNADDLDTSDIRWSAPLALVCGASAGVLGGLLGLGGGAVIAPMLQLLLKMPLKKAISNSAATVTVIAFVGAICKNATLGQHDIAVMESVAMAAVIIPGATIGAFVGARLTHTLPRDVVRMAFILLMALTSYKMLTVGPAQ